MIPLDAVRRMLADREVWICGSGPSLDLMSYRPPELPAGQDPRALPPSAAVVAVNETVYSIDRAELGNRPVVVVINDNIKLRRFGRREPHGAPDCDVVVVPEPGWRRAVEEYGWSEAAADRVATYRPDELRQSPGAFVTACDLAGPVASRIVLAGCDGGGGWAACADETAYHQMPQRQAASAQRGGYATARTAGLDVLSQCGAAWRDVYDPWPVEDSA